MGNNSKMKNCQETSKTVTLIGGIIRKKEMQIIEKKRKEKKYLSL